MSCCICHVAVRTQRRGVPSGLPCLSNLGYWSGRALSVPNASFGIPISQDTAYIYGVYRGGFAQGAFNNC